ncbi:MAG: type II toxin-antitoxin system VapC family toxin [Verrucomicrobia bacterium]|nr:type II toxin-antitoxin system VapC family toxin [Verrucomicrobiota bacterium]MBT7069178.1 type II toxin-antitoxin system VapC family toxin [Verrucomicrobiota bacterium]MBT7699612.1 type II toxin-antitoxin system VapC family toxin [Verrucomicrobiota bacterium]
MLDTDILIFMIRGLKDPDHTSARHTKAQRIRRRIQRHLTAGATVGVSMVTVCELEYGAGKSAHPEKERRAVSKLLAPFALLDCDAVHVPRHYGEIRCMLEKAGVPIGAMDLMIAAHAQAQGATLVTNNEAEFKRVQGLKVENWAKK